MIKGIKRLELYHLPWKFHQRRCLKYKHSHYRRLATVMLQVFCYSVVSLWMHSLSCPHEPANIRDLWELSIGLTKGRKSSTHDKKEQLTPSLYGSVFWSECLTFNWFNFKHKSIFSFSLSTAPFPQLWQDGRYLCNFSSHRPLSSDRPAHFPGIPLLI